MVENFEEFKQKVYQDFKKDKKNLKKQAQKRLPEVNVIDVKLIGSYAQGLATEESDIDILIKYSGNLSEQTVRDRLRGELGGYGGVYDVAAKKEALTDGLVF